MIGRKFHTLALVPCVRAITDYMQKSTESYMGIA
jgi:hypothetical protein